MIKNQNKINETSVKWDKYASNLCIEESNINDINLRRKITGVFFLFYKYKLIKINKFQ
jgi:hypothetical protein